MLKEGDVTFTFRIVVVCDLEEHISPKKKVKLQIKTENDIISLPNSKDKLMKYLISSCDKNEVDVIIVTSDIDSTVIFDVNQRTINKNVSTNIATFISKLELKLKRTFKRAVCGIRNKTLILNIYGSPEVATKCIEKYEELIQRTIQLIQNKTANIKSSIEITDAQKIIRDTIMQSNEKIEYERVNVHDAYGKVLLKDIYTTCNVPSFRTSAKYGYAIIVDGKKQKKIVEAKTIFSLTSDICVSVKTGTPIPNGATAVVKMEDTKLLRATYSNNNSKEDAHDEIEIIIQPKVGENIRPIGYEMKLGEKILERYTRIGLAEIGFLTSCGANEIVVIKHQSVGILSIGNELEEPGEILRSKHNYDGNRLALITLLKQEGFDALDFGIINDDIQTIISDKIQDALKKVNILVTTGSTDGRDRLKLILQEHFKATIYFDNVNVKPGKSTTFATCTLYERKKYLLCFTGNPAKVLIGAHLFLLPLLNHMCHNDLEAPIISACVINKHKKHSRPTYTWTHLKWDKTEADLFAKAYSIQNKSNLLKSHNGNALLMVPPSNSSNDTLLSPNTFTPVLFLQCYSK
ncbi:gephyrin-like [Polyergus mexicanus]|uniref:gephyrin-like n=1 Tax=Polyergus mexicanus TaxID=615972 RepID=UPI0038B49986